MNKLKIEKYIDKDLIYVRFKDLEDLKNHLNYFFNGCLIEETGELLEVKNICEKSYYDNDWQDWEILCEVGTEHEVYYDITIYYAKTRFNEKIIVETNFEEL